MASHFLTTASVLQCPHLGTVTATTSNTKLKADGAYVLRATDTFVIAGCTFMKGSNPNPCVKVQWVVHAMLTQADGAPALTRDSVGLCLDGTSAPQGTVVMLSVQGKAGGL
jgi:hypothetical protein